MRDNQLHRIETVLRQSISALDETRIKAIARNILWELNNKGPGRDLATHIGIEEYFDK
jgi:hypothetical protein